MRSQPDETSPETPDARVDMHCPSCGRLWHDPAPHAEDRVQWDRYWRQRSAP